MMQNKNKENRRIQVRNSLPHNDKTSQTITRIDKSYTVLLSAGHAPSMIILGFIQEHLRVTRCFWGCLEGCGVLLFRYNDTIVAERFSLMKSFSDVETPPATESAHS